jgi:tetratricopeptide (TPR) repeat protein
MLAALGLAAPHAWAWWKLSAARAALENHHPEEARRSLTACERVWGGRASVRLLACRAARQDGDPEAAAGELREAQRLLGGATEETAFEWALLRAATGNVREVEEYLQRQAERSPEEAGPLVWEALVVGYLRVYRTLDAMSCVNLWLKREPNNVRALELRGQTYVTGRGVVRGAEDFRRVLELDPNRKDTRRRLADAALALGGYEEAAQHLEMLAKDSRDDPTIAANLARCYALLQRTDDARRVIDAAVAKHPEDGLCRRTRGHIAILDQRFADAEADLRRAVERMPWDYQAQNLLFQALSHQGKVEDAKSQLKHAEKVRDLAERLADLQSRKLAEFPLDPALHYEMGTLLIETGRGEVGVLWLQSALQLDPNHKPSQSALAAYYQGGRAKN